MSARREVRRQLLAVRRGRKERESAREMEKPNLSGKSTKSFLRRVLLPVPDGPVPFTTRSNNDSTEGRGEGERRRRRGSAFFLEVVVVQRGGEERTADDNGADEVGCYAHGCSGGAGLTREEDEKRKDSGYLDSKTRLSDPASLHPASPAEQRAVPRQRLYRTPLRQLAPFLFLLPSPSFNLITRSLTRLHSAVRAPGGHRGGGRRRRISHQSRLRTHSARLLFTWIGGGRGDEVAAEGEGRGQSELVAVLLSVTCADDPSHPQAVVHPSLAFFPVPTCSSSSPTS